MPTKEDLLWEATRRNENYKNNYYEIMKLREIGDKHADFHTRHALNEWGMRFLLDPKVPFSNLQAQVDSVDEKRNSHPYIRFFGIADTPVILYQEFKFSANYALSRKSKQGFNGPKTPKESHINRLLISLNPFSKESEVLPPVKANLQSAKIQVKKSLTQLKKQGHFVFYERDIESYLKYLEVYDKIVSYIKDKYNDCEFEEGAIRLPNDFQYTAMANVENYNYNDDQIRFFKARENERKLISTSFEKSSYLIRKSPDILFSPARTKSIVH